MELFWELTFEHGPDVQFAGCRLIIVLLSAKIHQRRQTSNCGSWQQRARSTTGICDWDDIDYGFVSGKATAAVIFDHSSSAIIKDAQAFQGFARDIL